MVDINKRRKVIESKDPATLAPAAEPEKKGVDINARAAKLGINGRYSRVDQKAVNDELRKYAVSERPSTAEESILKGADSVVAGAIVPLVKIAEERERERQTNENISRSLDPMRGMTDTKQSRGASVMKGRSGEAMLRDERKIGDISKELDRLTSERRHAADELGRTFDSLGVDDPTLIVAPMRAKISEMDSKIAELEAAKAGAIERTAARQAESKALKYEQLDSRADFAENSKYSSTAHGKPVYNAWRMQGGYYDDTGFDDLTYDYINGNPTARSVARVNDLAIGATEAGIDMGYLATMTPEEVARYNYLYKTEGKEASEKYLKYISSDPDYTTATLNARRRAEQEKWAADYAREHPVVASIGSVLTSPTKGLSYIGQVADYLDDGKIDQNSGYNKWSYGNTAIRNEVSRIAEEKWGKVGSFLYQTGMSMGDFLLNAGITGGNQSLSLAIMGSGAAADATIEAKDKGLSDDQAFALGTIAGAAEVLTEKVSLETLLDKTSLSKGALGYWLKNVLAEGSEEVGSDLINTLADVLIAQDKSELRMAIDAYVKQGHTESEAVGLALKDMAADMGVSFLGGALSGGVMAAGPAAVSGIRSNTDPRIEFASDAPASTGVVIAENKTTTPATVEMPRSAAASMTESRMDTKNPNAQRVYNSREVETFVQNSDAFGENGKKAFTTMYDGGDFAAFYADFAANYNAGVRGTSRGNVTNRYSGTLNPAQALAAYSAGRNDAKTGASTRQTSSGLKIYSRSEAGLVAESAALIADEGERSTVDKLAKSLGVRVQIENIAPRADGSKVNGYIKDGDIHISAGADSVTTVLAHELSHRIQEAAPKEYAQYRRLVMEQLAREHGSDVNIVEQRKTEYQRGGIELSNEAAMDEIVADYAQRMMDDPAKFAEVANDNPNLARRLLNTLHNLIVRVKSALGNEAARLERIEAEWRRALSAAQHTVAKAQQTVETANTSTTAAAPSVAAAYSIKTAGDGSKYVEIDTDQHLFDNAPKKSYAAIARRVLLDRFAGQTLPLGENDLARLTAKQTGEYAYPHTPLDQQSTEYAAKMRASTELDNLLEAAEYSHWAKDTKSHKEATLGFDYYKTKFVLDGHSFEGLINIANSENGRVFYDITKIEETPAISKKPAAGMAQSASASPKSQPANSISDSGEDVNTKFSQEGQGIRYSIAYDASGTPYVVIDEDILAGVPRSEWVRTVKNNMREKFPNGVVVGNNEIAIDKQSRNEMTYSRYMQQLMKSDPAMFADKLRATNNADEIIRASRNYVNESLIHPRKDNIEQFARGEVQMRVGENDYVAQVVVAMRSNGKLLLYDIIDLTPTEISSQNKKSNAAKSVNPSPGVGRSTASGFSTPSISDSGEDVNTKFSQDGQGIRYSIAYDANGTPYVVIDEDILAGVPRSEWVRTVKNNMREKFPNGVVVGNNEIKINAKTTGEITESEYSKWIRDFIPERYRDKMLATNNADEIVRASRNYVGEGLKHPRKDNIIEFARGDVQLRIGSNDYTADVVVATTKSRAMVLYDMVNIMPTKIQTEKQTQAAATSRERISDRTLESASADSISELGEDVNTKFSQDGQGIRYSIDLGFASKVDEWAEDGQPPHESFVLGSTGEVLQGLGAIESDIYMLGEKISTIMDEHPEITLDEIKRIPEVLDDPVLILKSKGSNRFGENSRLVIFGSVKAKNGQPIMCVLDLRPLENGFLIDDMQKVSSAYTKDNPKKFILDSEVMYADKKRTIPLLRYTGFSSTGSLPRYGSMGSISYSGRNVNLSGVKFSDLVSVGKEGDTKFSLSEGESLTDAAGEGIITDEERGAILQYKSSDSFKINAKLRDGLELSEQEKRFVENLDSGLRKLPKVEGTLYRTLNFDDATDAEVALNAFLAEHKTGFPVRYLAYTSTSITPDGHPLADDVKFGVVMEIEGKTARSLEGFGNNFENEALYPRNTRFDVLSAERVADGIYHIKAREVVNDAGESKGRMGLHPEERDGTVREVSETHRTHNDLRGVSGVDTGRGDGQEGRLSGLRAEGVDEKFSLSQNKRANEVEYLRELNDYLREQMRLTSRPRMTQNAMNEVVRDVTSRWGSAAKKSDITEKLWRLYGEMASGKDSDGGALAWETVRDEATEIAGEILRGAVQQSNPMYEEYGELRRTLRNTKIAISETDKADLADVGGYTEFRKQNEHRLTLSKNGVPVDQIYDELHERYGELFPAGITHPADQLIHIADVLDSLQPVYENVYSEQEMAEANDYIAAELIDGFYSVPTEGMETERVRAEKNARIEQVKMDGREAMRRAVQAERESKERAVENLKKQYEKREQRRADSATRQKLLKLMQRCERMKTTPQNKAKIAELIGELDTVSVGITGKTLAELEGIKDHVERMRELDPDYMPNPKTLEAIERISKKRVADMSMEDVTDLIKALRNIETEARNERRMVDSAEKLDIYIAGEQLIEDVRAAKGTSKVKAASALIAETLSPERYVKRITGYREGNALVTAMKELSDGQRKSLDYRRRSEALLEKFTSDKKFMASITGKNAKTVKISAFKGGELTNVEITRDMLISLYLASKNEQNLYHMAEGGVRVPDMALYRKGKIGDAYDRGTVVKIAPGVAKSAVLKLTEQERAYAEVIHYYFNSVSKAAINEVSMKLRGYEAAEVEEYYPIQSDSAYTRSSPETVISKDASIANPGWLEKRETRASNPLRLIDATKVTSDAIAQHGMYYGIAIPANNMVKLLNVTVSEMDENTGERIKYSDSVRNALKNVWGAEAEDYLNGILSDVQKRGGGSDGALGAMLGKLRSGYAGAVLTLNASVALKQAASYTTAAAEIGWKPLVKAMKDFGSVDLDLIAKYTPLQWYRSLGYSSTELGDMAKNKKQLPKALNWIQFMDVATTRKLWKASEYYVRDSNKALKVGTEEYYREVADVYNRVIENTQPNYTAMQRSKVLRSDNQLVRSLMMFKTQPFQNFNILYDAAGEYAAKTRQYKANPNAETKAAAKTARGRLAAAITSQLVSAVIFASMTAVWNMFRGKTGAYEDEEKDEMTVESFLAKLGKDTLSSLMGSVPFGSDVYNFAASKLFDETYYGMEVSSVSAISDLAESVSNLWSVVESAADASTGADNWSNVWVEFDRSADNITKVFGVPYENVVNLINASARWAMKRIFGKYLGDYYALRMTTNTKRSTEYYDCLWRAYRNDQDAYEKIYADMVKSGFSEDAIRSNMEKRMKDEQGVEKVGELDSRYLSPEQSKDYDALAREVAASRLWRSATSGQKESAEEMMYDLATNNGDGKKLAEKVDGGAEYGLSETDYILYKLALERVDAPSESGKYGTYTNDEVQAAIDMVDGLSDAARAYLWEAAGKNAKTNPYR